MCSAVSIGEFLSAPPISAAQLGYAELLERLKLRLCKYVFLHLIEKLLKLIQE